MCSNLKQLRVKFSSLCKTAFSFFLSHFGLCIMVILYLVAGSFIFEYLEKENEVQECFDNFRDYNMMEIMTLDSLKTVVYSHNPESDQLTAQVEGILETFRDNVMDIRYDGKDCAMYGQPGGPQYKWSWLGSFLFVVTVVSTIGYGHIAPKTVWGRIVCISYAMIGIPLTMIFLAAIGNTLANVVRLIYNRIIYCNCCRRKKKKPNKKKLTHIQSDGKASGSKSQTAIVSNLQIAEPTDSLRYRIYTRKRDIADDEIRISTCLTSTDSMVPSRLDPISTLDEANQTKVKIKIDTQNIKIMTQANIQQRHKIVPHQSLIADDDESDDEEDDVDEETNTGVPLTMALLIMTSYIAFGVVLFGIWRDWDILQATYFCFISLSTIGFGDLVPGTDFTLPSAQAELVFGSIYIMFGLAFVSMCFALMQEEFVEKITWIGKKFGVVQNDEE